MLDTASVLDTAHALDTAPVLPGSRRAPWAALWPCRAQAPCRAPARAPWGRAALWSCGRQICTTFVHQLTGVTAVMHQLFAVIHVTDRGPRPSCISCYGFIRCPVCSRLLRRATLRTSTSDMRHNRLEMMVGCRPRAAPVRQSWSDGITLLGYKSDRSTQNLCSLTVQKSESGGVLIRATLNPLPQTWLKSIRYSFLASMLASGGNELPIKRCSDGSRARCATTWQIL